MECQTERTEAAEKVVLPEPLQREMINFFREAAALKQAREIYRQTSPNPNIAEGE